MGAKFSVLGLIMSFSQYMRSAMVRFPFCKTVSLCPLQGRVKLTLCQSKFSEVMPVYLFYIQDWIPSILTSCCSGSETTMYGKIFQLCRQHINRHTTVITVCNEYSTLFVFVTSLILKLTWNLNLQVTNIEWKLANKWKKKWFSKKQKAPSGDTLF